MTRLKTDRHSKWCWAEPDESQSPHTSRQTSCGGSHSDSLPTVYLSSLYQLELYSYCIVCFPGLSCHFLTENITAWCQRENQIARVCIK